MQINEIIPRFSGVKPNGKNSYQAKCPCHDDKTASLTISEQNNKILMYCHAGCDVQSICAAVGISQSDLFTEPIPTISSKKETMREVCRYIYTDADGIPIHTTIRYEPKSFRQAALNPNGSIKEWSLKNTNTVLYNLPAVIAAHTVYIVEGEKDADNLKGLGFVATTSPMGASKWKRSYTETLRGKNVIIIPDNDAAGRKHVETVCLALKGNAQSVKIARLTGVPNKGDVSDYLAEAHSYEEAQNMILSLPLTEDLTAVYADTIPTSSVIADVEISDYSDIGVADAFSRYYGGIARFSSSLGWLVWDGKRWDKSDLKAQSVEVSFTDIIREQALKSGDKDYIKFATRMRSYNRVQGVLGIAKSRLEISNDELDSNPCDFNTPAGIVDLKTGKIRPHEPKAFCTKMTGVSPVKQKSELFEKFLDDITLGNAELKKYIQCIAGMSCLGKVYNEVLIIAYGGGHNGKSTLFNTLYEILGDYSGKIPAECLTTKAKNPKNDLAELSGKRLVIASETEEGNRLSTAMLKQVSSTDPLSAEKKFRDPFVFIPTHSLVLYTNHLPKIGSDDNGTWRRLVPVPFTAKIENPQLNLAERLFEEAGGAILQWCIEGAEMFIKNGYRLPENVAVNSAKEQYRAENDWAAQFLDDCCNVAPYQAESGSKMYEAYTAWCLKTGEYKRASRDFAHALEAKGFVRKKVSRGNSWHGVCLLRECQ